MQSNLSAVKLAETNPLVGTIDVAELKAEDLFELEFLLHKSIGCKIESMKSNTPVMPRCIPPTEAAYSQTVN